LIGEVESLIYTQYVRDTNIQHVSYIKHFLKDGIEYTTYPMTASYTEQVQWLCKNIKKPKDIWLAKLIITNYLTGNQQFIGLTIVSIGVLIPSNTTENLLRFSSL